MLTRARHSDAHCAEEHVGTMLAKRGMMLDESSSRHLVS